MKKTILLAAVFIIMLVPFVFAGTQYHTVLLAVEDRSTGLKGSVADLSLELREGTGRVFIDTYPLTKFDTQISTRFAKEIACDYLDLDCDTYDFIYTIKADSTLVGGPSAGAATTLLTIGALQDKELDSQIAITGTINSGGFIGPVGGIKQKIEAAQSAGLKKVLIPKGRRFAQDEANVTCSGDNCSLNMTDEIDLVAYGNSLGIEVIEAGNLDTAWQAFSGELPDNQSISINPDNPYFNTMAQLARILCERTENLSSQAKHLINDSDSNVSNDLNDIQNFTQRAAISFGTKDYYSSASFCFGANVKAREVLYRSQQPSKKEILDEINKAYARIIAFETQIAERQKETITDLETFMIVKERLLEAKETLNETYQQLKKNEDALPTLSYGTERYYSALSWAKFFGLDGKAFSLDQQALKDSCQKKILEVEERHQYVSLFIPQVNIQRKELEHAQDNLKAGNFELCLFQASKAKAEVDIVLSAYGTDADHIDELIEEKKIISQKQLAKEIGKGVFPILGYSYYEYGSVLAESDPYSALLYLEYALELSSLDIYFEGKENGALQNTPEAKTKFSWSRKSIALVAIILFFLGLLIGVSLGKKYSEKKLMFSIKPKEQLNTGKKKRKK